MSQTGYLRRAGRDGVDGYAVRPQLHRHSLSETDDPCFRRTIGDTPGAAKLTRHRRNVGDASAARFRHRTGRGLAADERPGQVTLSTVRQASRSYSRNGARLTIPALFT